MRQIDIVIDQAIEKKRAHQHGELQRIILFTPGLPSDDAFVDSQRRTW